MHCLTPENTDTTISGFWKKDRYIGEYDKPYYIYYSSSPINKIEAKLLRKGGDNISFTIRTLIGGVTTITGINVLAGSYNGKNDMKMAITSITNLQQVQFPFRATFYFSNGSTAEILINEKASWDFEIEMIRY